MSLYDVIILGGGPSGSTVASLMAEKGHKVIVLEKEKFPREHIGESLIPASYFTLKRLGVLEELEKISPRKPGVNFVDSDGTIESLWCFKNVVKNESYLSFHVKRSIFDEMLLNNSRRKGAEVREETHVKDVKLDNADGTVEVHAVNKEGQREIFKGRFFIDASGLSTFMASKTGTKKPFKDLDRVAVWSHWSNVKYDTALSQGAIKLVYVGAEKKGWFWVIPISAQHLSIGVVLNNSYLKQRREKIVEAGSKDWKHDLYMYEIENSPTLKKLLTGATLDHTVQVTGDYSYYCEKKYGDNFALVGDAAAFLDPIFSSGIFVGMYSAELVSDALDLQLRTGEKMHLMHAYEKINGAVGLVEKFVKLFYSPEVVNFSHMGHPEKLLEFKQTEAMYTIFHYLLSGDFFHNYEKYSEFIDNMRDQKMAAKFQNLIQHTRDYTKGAHCGELHEEMYGKVNKEIVYDKSLF